MSHLIPLSDLWGTYCQSPFSWEASREFIPYKPNGENAAQLSAKKERSGLDETNNASQAKIQACMPQAEGRKKQAASADWIERPKPE